MPPPQRPATLHQDILQLLTRAPACRTDPPPEYKWTPAPFLYVMPYCERDAHLLAHLLEWVSELCGTIDRQVVFITDDTISAPAHLRVETAAKAAFARFHTEFLNMGTKGVPWPGANNLVFAAAAKLIAKYQMPWFWLETDMVPVRADWVETLEAEYNRAKQPFMGAWVEYYDIFNGAAIYPPDVVEWAPTFFAGDAAKAAAFDCALAPEMIWFCHNASHLMPHVWCNRANGRPGGFVGTPPDWTRRMLDWVINHNAVILHRCKDEKVISLLREKLFDSSDTLDEDTHSTPHP